MPGHSGRHDAEGALTVATRRTFPARISLRRGRFTPVDVVVAFAVLALLYGALRLGKSMTVTFTPGRSTVALPTGLSHLPYYAARSLLRMFIALFASTVFTFVYGTAAVASCSSTTSTPLNFASKFPSSMRMASRERRPPRTAPPVSWSVLGLVKKSRAAAVSMWLSPFVVMMRTDDKRRSNAVLTSYLQRREQLRLAEPRRGVSHDGRV